MGEAKTRPTKWDWRLGSYESDPLIEGKLPKFEIILVHETSQTRQAWRASHLRPRI